MLWWAARRATCPGFIADELISIGWLRVVRYSKPGQLKYIPIAALREMRKYIAEKRLYEKREKEVSAVERRLSLRYWHEEKYTKDKKVDWSI